jgi:DNA-binding transcriptional LysR family regulator
MAHDIDMALMRAFLAVVDTGSVTAAARLLNRTQSAISLQIKRLEEFFGCEVFERQHRKLILTPMGEQLLGRAQRLIQLNDDIWGELTTPAFEGEVRLGVPDDLIAGYVPQILRRFNQAWPRVSVSLTCSSSADCAERRSVRDTSVPSRQSEKLVCPCWVCPSLGAGRGRLVVP